MITTSAPQKVDLLCSRGDPTGDGEPPPCCGAPATHIVYLVVRTGSWPCLRCRRHALELLVTRRVIRASPLRYRL